MSILEDYRKNLIVGVRVGSLYVYKQLYCSDTVYCYCCNCNRDNIQIPISKIKYWLKHNTNITCGCESESKNEDDASIDLGTSYSALMVVKKLSNKKYECICECGRLTTVDEKALKDKVITRCPYCEGIKVKEKDYYYNDRVRKELYYIWNSYLHLYENPTKDFQYKIINKGIRFFPELNNDFNLFYEWALKNNYRKGGAIYMEREDKNQDYTVNNSKWSEEDNSKLIDFPKSVLKNSKDEVFQRRNLTPEMLQVANNESREEVKEAKEKLLDYFYNHYRIKYVPKSIQELLKQLNNGTSKKYGYVEITYDKLLDMLRYYEPELLKLYGENLKRSKLKTANERLAYDIVVMIDYLEKYDNRIGVKYNELNNNVGNSTEWETPEAYEIRYRWLNQKRQKEAEEEFERIEEIKRFAREEGFFKLSMEDDEEE